MFNRNNKRNSDSFSNRGGQSLAAPMAAAGVSAASLESFGMQQKPQHNQEHTKANKDDMVADYFADKDTDLDSQLSSSEVSMDAETFATVDANSNEYISQDELSDYVTTLEESLQSDAISFGEFHESMQSLDLIPGQRMPDMQEIEVVNVDGTNEATLNGDYIQDAITITLDDTSSDADSVTVNLSQVDGDDQIIKYMLVDGIEDVTLNVVQDADNATDDIVVLNELVLDDTETLTVVSQESVMIGHIKSDSLETIDLTQAKAGFEIHNVDSANVVTFKIDDLGDGVGKINFDSDNDSILDSSVSVINLSRGVEDIIEFGSQSLNDSLLINNIELSDNENSDTLDFSALGIDSVDELVISDSDYFSTEITSDAFDGTIILTGITADQIDSSNFVFE